MTNGWVPPSDSNSSVSGWTCINCGAFVPNSVVHSCVYQTGGNIPFSGTTLPLLPTCAGLQRDHEYARFNRTRLYCRHCGEMKAVKP